MRRLFTVFYTFVFITATFLLYIPIPEVQAINSANTSATVVVGQKGFRACDNWANQGDAERGLYTPLTALRVGDKLVVADAFDNRVFIYNSIPTVDFPLPDVIIGQPDACNIGVNSGGSVAANTLYNPYSLSSDGTRLFIADFNNSRVLIYNHLPTTNYASADIVVGQMDMNHRSVNQGGSVAANTLSGPSGVYSDGTLLFIADRGNHRVLLYNHIPEENGHPADLVLGQSDFLSATANSGGRSASSLNEPFSVYFDGTRLFTSERGNHRVLMWNSLPTVNKTAADIVIGQPDFSTGGANQGGLDAGSLYSPNGVFSDGTHIMIGEYYNHRVLLFNSIPLINNPNADVVIGQQDFTHNSSNQGAATAANTLYSPHYITYSEDTLYIADSGNHRILQYNSLPTINNASANLVIGQSDMTGRNVRASNPEANTLSSPYGTFSDGTKLFVTDQSNHRVLIYNSIPESHNATADVVIGQVDFTHTLANQGGSVGANTLCTPKTVFSNGTKLYIVDQNNHRILIYNHIPEENNHPADVVIGQVDFIHNSANQGGSVNSNTLKSPGSAFTDGTKLYVADGGNNRILIYNTIPSTNNASADIVVGQVDFTHNSENQGGSSGANTLYYPSAAYVTANKLFISDNNHRILIFNTIPTSNNASADVVVGQANFSGNSANQGGSVGANTISSPKGIYSDGIRLFIVDQWNHRILIYNTIPSSNNTSADVVIGQPNFTSNPANQGGNPGANTLYTPSFVYSDGERLYTAEVYNNRAFIYPLGPQGTSLTAPSYTTSLTNTLTLGADDAKEMMVSEDNIFTGLSWETFTTSKEFTLSNGDGIKTVYAKMRDYANYEGEVLSAQITYDTTGPTGSISINSGDTITNTDEVTLTLTATDNLTEVKKMMVSNKVDYSGGTWETYNTSKEWRLSMGDGEKRVYVKYRDEVGNISSSYSDSIEMDMGSPTGTLIINEGEEYTSSREVVLHITGEDEVTGVEEMRISEDRTMEGVEWEGYTTSREYTLSEGDGYKVIYIQYRDGIGNESEVYGSNITLDRNTEIEVTEIGEEEVEGEIENWETEETTPTFTGEGEVGATITIEIEGIETGTVVVNEDGVWSWTPSLELTKGQKYNVTITSTDLAGNEDIQTFILGISDEEVIEVNQTTPEAQTTTTQLPNTGVILIVGLMVIGGLIWNGYNLKMIEKLRRMTKKI